MKKRVLFFACISMLFSVGTKAQITPFSVKWESKGTGSGSYGIVKTVTGNVAGTALETSSGSFGNLGTLELYAYSNSTNAASVTGLAADDSWGRFRATATVPNFSDNDVVNTAHYAQYIIEPTNSKFLRLTDISVVAVGGGTGNVRMVVKYSLDGNNFLDMPALATYYDAAGTAATYAATDATTAIPLVASNTTGQTQDKRAITYSNLKINVDNGQKVYLRFYPYLTGTTGSSRYLFLRLSSFSGVTSDSTLPLDLLSFSAKPDALGKTVNLAWKTANEVNTQDFIVERRSDNTEFSAVGTVLSKNTPGTHSYSFTDLRPLSGTSYYRLKQRDKDGKYSNSEPTDVKIENIALNIFPNPVSKELVVSHEYVKQPSVFKVVGLDGKNLVKANTSVGSSSTTINVSALPSGTYVLVYEGEGKPQSQKFIKK